MAINKTDSEAQLFAKRFKTFRIAFIDPIQLRAAEKLGITKSYLSKIESGAMRPNLDLLEKLMDECNLNPEWLSTGLGDKQTTGRAKPTARGSLERAHDDIGDMHRSMKILHSHMNKLFDIIEKQQKQIDDLNRRVK